MAGVKEMRERLLIVDDEADIVTMLRDYFEMNDYEVMTAYSGQEAFKKSGIAAGHDLT